MASTYRRLGALTLDARLNRYGLINVVQTGYCTSATLYNVDTHTMPIKVKDPNEYKDMAKRVADMRQALGLSQAELGSVAGFSQHTISAVEGARRKCPKGLIQALESYHDGYRPEDWPDRIINRSARPWIKSVARREVETAISEQREMWLEQQARLRKAMVDNGQIRAAVMMAWHGMGGNEALTEWAKANPTAFYTKVLPQFIKGDAVLDRPGDDGSGKAAAALQINIVSPDAYLAGLGSGRGDIIEHGEGVGGFEGGGHPMGGWVSTDIGASSQKVPPDNSGDVFMNGDADE